MNPTISVIMSVYNEPIEWLKLSIDSICHQTYKDFEFIIICDNPYNKENLSILNKYKQHDSRITLIVNNKNIGLTKSLNKGLEIAKGKYIARMDADDISLPFRFEKQICYMESHPNTIVLGTNIIPFGYHSFLRSFDFIKFTNDDIKAQMLLINPIAHSTVLIRKKILDQHVIKYDEAYLQSQDYRLWEQLLPYGDFANLNEKLLYYRLSPQQISNNNRSGQRGLASSVSLRLQLNWLNTNGFNCSMNELEKECKKIVIDLRNSQLRYTKEYNAFIQYAYLKSLSGTNDIMPFLKYDWRSFSFLNFIRLLSLKLHQYLSSK